MPRRIAFVSLLCAWLCASGAMLDLAQGVAWARMFVGYAGRESVVAAARDTFDPAKPCAICVAVGKARAAGQHGTAAPAAGAEKLVMICQESGSYMGSRPDRAWSKVDAACPPGPAEDVPQPPPRAVAG
jgi:hypothetical protein